MMIPVDQFRRFERYLFRRLGHQIVTCLLSMMILSGCQHPVNSPPPPPLPPDAGGKAGEEYSLVNSPPPLTAVTPQSQNQLAEGLNAFSNQDFKTALTIFTWLVESQDDPYLKRNAQYGIACTRLTLADTPDEMEAAMVEWVKWVQLASGDLSGEDPCMLDLALHNFRVLFNKETERSAIDQQQIDQLQSQLKLKEQQIKKLKKQILEIEAIHQKTQEKIRQMTPKLKGTEPIGQ